MIILILVGVALFGALIYETLVLVALFIKLAFQIVVLIGALVAAAFCGVWVAVEWYLQRKEPELAIGEPAQAELEVTLVPNARGVYTPNGR